LSVPRLISRRWVAKIMGNVFIQRVVQQNGNGFDIEIRLKNHGTAVHTFNLHETLPYNIESASPEPKKITLGKQTDHLWKVSLKPGEQKALIYKLNIEAKRLQNCRSLWLDASMRYLSAAQRS